ncbi:SF1B family DNA helicase RecD2 [Lapidilactobacillus luobeiensis]|uniref:SF1B family DNA helicase RecD2 n=1 Tax=Lapidilactobacillus luobeiensis TaxID=2950371 RepID=UPI0021C35CC8|nr:ATP-dependent RecD-like DNA helicase [Lapidilactobacillus luobeiensis]
MSKINEAVTLIGTVLDIRYEDPKSYFKIVIVKIKQADFNWPDPTITVKGDFGELDLDQPYEFKGKLVVHSKYGTQIQVTSAQHIAPSTSDSLVQYFSGDRFPGIGKVAAKKIVSHFGVEAIDEIMADPDQLAEIGLKPKQVTTILTQLRESYGTEKMILSLTQLGLTPWMISQAMKNFGGQTLAVLQEDPYQLALKVPQIGFKRVDQLAENLAIAFDAPVRIQGALIQFLRNDLLETGDAFVDVDLVLEGALTLLRPTRRQVPTDEQIANELVTLAGQGLIVAEEHRLYLGATYLSEVKIAQELRRIQKTKIKAWDDTTFQKALRQLERRYQVSYNEQQVKAIRAALDQPLSVLTGGPGTGKTTILLAVVQLFAQKNDFKLSHQDQDQEDAPIKLAAPTGRAAKRLNELTDLPARTLHSLLGLAPNDDQFSEMIGNDLQGQLLIVDEMSMVDQRLFQTLIQAIPEGMQLLLVGDQDQLPSVGPGRVFADLIASDHLPVTELTAIYRQSDDSTIINLARAIRDGQVPADLTANLPDRSFISCGPAQVAHVVEQVIQKSLRRNFTLNETQILAPMYRYDGGIDQINTAVQALVNPKKTARTKEVQANNGVFRIGDKVIQLQNEGQLGIYNGDIGQITGIREAQGDDDAEPLLIIDFSGLEVEIPQSSWHNLSLAYCISIHKSQGSEYQLVILPLTMNNRMMLQRKLLYTAVTRSKNKLVMVGEPAAFAQAIRNQGSERQTTLAARIREIFTSGKTLLTHLGESVQEAAADYKKTPPVAADQVTVTLDQPEQSAAMTSVDAQKSKQSEIARATNSTTSTDKVSYVLTPQLVAANTIDPLIGMAELRPENC